MYVGETEIANDVVIKFHKLFNTGCSCNHITIFQFRCVNGRIVLSLEYHLWCSSLIKSSSSSNNFIQQLSQLIAATSQNISEDHDSSANFSEPCSSSSNQKSDTMKRRSSILQSPSNRCKYNKDTMNEGIERHKKSFVNVCM